MALLNNPYSIILVNVLETSAPFHHWADLVFKTPDNKGLAGLVEVMELEDFEQIMAEAEEALVSNMLDCRIG